MKLSVKGQFCLLLFTTFSYRLTCIFSCAIEFPVTGFDTFTCPNNLLILQIFSFKTIVTVKPFFISYCKNFYSHVYTSAHTHTHTHLFRCPRRWCTHGSSTASCGRRLSNEHKHLGVTTAYKLSLSFSPAAPLPLPLALLSSALQLPFAPLMLYSSWEKSSRGDMVEVRMVLGVSPVWQQ